MKGRRVSWLNLHEWIPIRDVRKLIYALLDACDRECVEAAHGVRPVISFAAACVAASKGHLKLVRHLKMSPTPWNNFNILWAATESTSSSMIEWACTQPGYLLWEERERVMRACLEKGFFELAWRLNTKRAFPFPTSTYHWCVLHRRLDFAMQVHKKFPNLAHPHYPPLLDSIIRFADVRFYRWATLVKHLQPSAEQREKAYKKWPELAKRIKL